VPQETVSARSRFVKSAPALPSGSVASTPPSVRLEKQGLRLKLSVPGSAWQGERAKRGKCLGGFPPSVRKRFLDMLMSISWDLATVAASVKFITLTYGQKFPDAEKAKRDLQVFWQRVRRIHPSACAVWRLELQRRGFIHFHLILIGVPFWDKEDMAATWADVIGPEYCDCSGPVPRAPFTRIERVQSPGQMRRYLTKYVCKRATAETLPRVEASASVSGVAASAGFNSPSYSTADFVGRQWGVMNRESFPFAKVEETQLPLNDDRKTERALTQIRRLLRRSLLQALALSSSWRRR